MCDHLIYDQVHKLDLGQLNPANLIKEYNVPLIDSLVSTMSLSSTGCLVGEFDGDTGMMNVGVGRYDVSKASIQSKLWKGYVVDSWTKLEIWRETQDYKRIIKVRCTAFTLNSNGAAHLSSLLLLSSLN